MDPRDYSAYPDLLSFCNDAVFKAIFTQKTPESKTALKGAYFGQK